MRLANITNIESCTMLVIRDIINIDSGAIYAIALMIKVLDSKSRGPAFKTTGRTIGWLILSPSRVWYPKPTKLRSGQHLKIVKDFLF